MKPKIWMYWESPEGRHRAPYLDLCEETVRRHARGEVIVLNDQTIHDFIPEVRARVWELSPNHRSDYFRSRLVHLHGGLWLDADVVAFEGLQDISRLVERGQFVGYGRQGMSANFFGGPAGHLILERWMHCQDTILEGDHPLQKWNAFGRDCLTTSVEGLNVRKIDAPRVAPIPWHQWWLVLTQFSWAGAVLRRDQATVMLYNKYLGPRLYKVPHEGLIRSKTLLGQLFRISLGYSTVEDERHARRIVAPLAYAYWTGRTRATALLGRLARRSSPAGRGV